MSESSYGTMSIAGAVGVSRHVESSETLHLASALNGLFSSKSTTDNKIAPAMKRIRAELEARARSSKSVAEANTAREIIEHFWPEPKPDADLTADAEEEVKSIIGEELLGDRRERMRLRIKGLLEKSASTKHDEEAQLLIAKAEELMLRYSISEMELDPDTDTEQTFVRTVVKWPYDRVYWPSVGRVGSATIVEAIGLNSVAVSNSTRSVVLYGTERDNAFVAAILQSVWAQTGKRGRRWAARSAEYQATTRGGGHTQHDATSPYWTEDKGCRCWDEGVRLSASYRVGFCRGAADKILDSRVEVASESESTAIVLANNLVRIHQFMDGQVRPASKRQKVPNIDGASFYAGYVEGKDSDLGTPITNDKENI